MAARTASASGPASVSASVTASVSASVSAGLSVRPGAAAPTPYALLVLETVATIPRGGAVTYADVAEQMGRGSARTVGTALSRYGREVPWQRVVQASGRPAEPYLAQALALLRAEGCPMVGDRVDLTAARQRVRWGSSVDASDGR